MSVHFLLVCKQSKCLLISMSAHLLVSTLWKLANGDDCFYIALFSALEHSLRSHVILHE